MKTYVDQDTCIACGLCVSTCSDVYQFNEEGKAAAQVDIVPGEMEADAREAAENCPTSAIEIEEQGSMDWSTHHQNKERSLPLNGQGTLFIFLDLVFLIVIN